MLLGGTEDYVTSCYKYEMIKVYDLEFITQWLVVSVCTQIIIIFAWCCSIKKVCLYVILFHHHGTQGPVNISVVQKRKETRKST